MVTPLKFVGDERALLQALRARHPGAVAAFYDAHAGHVQRTLRSAMGADADLPDMLQEVFIRALDNIADLDDPERMRSWLTTIAVFTARAHIRRRARRNWLSLFSPERTRSEEQEPPCSDARAALRETYAVLDRMRVDDRMAFVLRFVDGMTLPDAAEACGVSLATIKRRLARAEKAFIEAARQRPILEQWLERGTRWNLRKQG
ncbi:MAG: RNA polymerase sigma factor [Myxococcota bacterium]